MTKKKTVIAIVTAVIAALLLYIVLHHNPFANQNEEMIKKIISCVILIAIYLVFILKYDKIVILPVLSHQVSSPNLPGCTSEAVLRNPLI